MKTAIVLIFALVTLLLVGCSHEPSQKQTLQWMHDFLPEHAGDFSVVGNSEWRASYALENKGCQVTITDVEERKNDPTLHDYTHIYQFSLSDLDPSTVKVLNFPAVGVDTADKRSVIHMWEEGTDYPQWGFHIILHDEDDASRFAKAMKHAVILCGGKPSTF